MGNNTSSWDREELGERIFQFATILLNDTDDAKLERVTGVVLDSSPDLHELQHLFLNDTTELERRIKLANSVIERQTKKNAECKPSAKCKNTVSPPCPREEKDSKRQELIKLFERLHPTIDSRYIANQLLELPDKELNYVISTPSELNNFIKSCSSKTEEHEQFLMTQGPTAVKLESTELLNELTQTKYSSKTELSEEDVQSLIGDHLFQRVSKMHPSQAANITGVLMELEKDTVLHLLVSAPLLHKNIALILRELEKKDKLKTREQVTLREELGNVIFSLLENEIDADKCSHVTGMLLELSLADIHEVLADESAFQSSVKAALNAIEKRN